MQDTDIGLAHPKAGGSAMSQANKLMLCPYCGNTQSTPQRCESCSGQFDATTRRATQVAMGPWFIRDKSAAFRPGISYQMLRSKIEAGKVKPNSIVRGPTTHQFWSQARKTPGVAHLVGYCHACGTNVQPTDGSCPECFEPFPAPQDRNELGLMFPTAETAAAAQRDLIRERAEELAYAELVSAVKHASMSDNTNTPEKPALSQPTDTHDRSRLYSGEDTDTQPPAALATASTAQEKRNTLGLDKPIDLGNNKERSESNTPTRGINHTPQFAYQTDSFPETLDNRDLRNAGSYDMSAGSAATVVTKALKPKKGITKSLLVVTNLVLLGLVAFFLIKEEMVQIPPFRSPSTGLAQQPPLPVGHDGPSSAGRSVAGSPVHAESSNPADRWIRPDGDQPIATPFTPSRLGSVRSNTDAPTAATSTATHPPINTQTNAQANPLSYLLSEADKLVQVGQLPQAMTKLKAAVHLLPPGKQLADLSRRIELLERRIAEEQSAAFFGIPVE